MFGKPSLVAQVPRGTRQVADSSNVMAVPSQLRSNWKFSGDCCKSVHGSVSIPFGAGLTSARSMLNAT